MSPRQKPFKNESPLEEPAPEETYEENGDQVPMSPSAAQPQQQTYNRCAIFWDWENSVSRNFDLSSRFIVGYLFMNR